MVREGRKKVRVSKKAVRGPDSKVERRDLGFCEKAINRAILNRERKRKDKINADARLDFKVGSRLDI